LLVPHFLFHISLFWVSKEKWHNFTLSLTNNNQEEKASSIHSHNSNTLECS